LALAGFHPQASRPSKAGALGLRSSLLSSSGGFQPLMSPDTMDQHTESLPEIDIEEFRERYSHM
jgi:hypothetical protein